MDNLTHTLVGMAVAEAAASSRAAPASLMSGSGRRAMYVAAIVASNLPDIDLLLTPITGGKLGYLLHHRGHTHTLMAVPILVVGLMAALWLWRRRHPVSWRRNDWLGLLAVALFSSFLHLGLDYLNNYGVHVFWPFDNRWSYGDAVFVLEPWLWIVLALPLVQAMQSVWTRAFLRLVSCAALTLIWFTGLVPTPMSLVVTGTALLLWGAGRIVRDCRGPWVSLTSAAVLIGIFAAAAQHMRTYVRTLVGQQFAATRMIDLVLTPLPADLLCWDVLAVGSEADHYVVRQGAASLLPNWWPAEQCPELQRGRTAPLAVVHTAPGTETAGLHWRGAYSASVSDMRQAASNCEVAAFMRFARVPFRVGSLWGDLRYDREADAGFAEMHLGESGRCPQHVPPWEPPLRW